VILHGIGHERYTIKADCQRPTDKRKFSAYAPKTGLNATRPARSNVAVWPRFASI